jgi:hypothetical protein
MKTTYNLRLPEELCEKIEREAKKNNVSINQYILYTLTKSISYNEALQQLHEELKDVPEMNIDEMLSRIPDRKPHTGDEI